MFRRILTATLLTVFYLSALTGQAIAQETAAFDLTRAEKGVIAASYPQQGKKIKLMIKKDGTAYYYDLNKDGETFPLQMGAGPYNLALLENLSDNKYTVKYSEDLDLRLENDKISFLQSANPIYWRQNDSVAQLAAALTQGIKGDREKAQIIYEYLINNIKYDYRKADNLEKGYLPSAVATLSSQKGICYDYAVLYAAMLRSIGIPTKLVKGYKDDIDAYHAWNQVYLEDSGWVIVDTTYDAVLIENGLETQFQKAFQNYTPEKEY